MNWIAINTEEEVAKISESGEYAIIYKHSPRCMTSLMAYRQLKTDVSNAAHISLPIYIVDVISNRRESMAVAETFQVQHQSPQILIVKDGQCLYDASHENVSLQDTLKYVS